MKLKEFISWSTLNITDLIIYKFSCYLKFKMMQPSVHCQIHKIKFKQINGQIKKKIQMERILFQTKQASMTNYLCWNDGSILWNVIFTQTLHDWEMNTMTYFMDLIYSTKIQSDVMLCDFFLLLFLGIELFVDFKAQNNGLSLTISIGPI